MNTSLSFAGEIEFVVSYSKVSKMSSYGFRLEYAPEGSSNYIAWKDKMEAVLEDNMLNEFIDKDIPNLANAKNLT